MKSTITSIGFNEEYSNMNKKAILKVGVIIILGVVLASAMSSGVLADAPTESEYSDILNDTEGDGTISNPHVVTTLDELQSINSSLSAHYVLGNDINASETELWNSGAGFTPIGKLRDPFSGNFNGQGYTVDGLYINLTNSYDIGLFGDVNSADIKNIGVTNIDIQGGIAVGGLVGDNNNGANITKSYSTGSVTGEYDVGGLVGSNRNTTIEKSYSHSNVSGGDKVGGLVGENRRYSNITNSFSSGEVSGNYDVGGLVGYNRNANITKSYSKGSVTGEYDVGGLVGDNVGSSYINKSYSVGSVTGDTNLGGLVGGDNDEYSTVADSYWDSETSNLSTSAGSAIGLTTDEMTGSAAPTNMVGFDFTSVWSTVLASDADSSADSYPILASVDSVIVSESSSEEYGGMSTLVSVALFFVLFSVMVLLLVKD